MYEQLREYIEESNNIVFFGGAGMMSIFLVNILKQ